MAIEVLSHLFASVHLAKTYKAMKQNEKYKEWLNKALALESVGPLFHFST